MQDKRAYNEGLYRLIRNINQRRLWHHEEEKGPCKKDYMQPLDRGRYLFQFEPKTETDINYCSSSSTISPYHSLLQILGFSTRKVTVTVDKYPIIEIMLLILYFFEPPR